MAQYEWVDVYSLKRWGDPATEGTVDGIIGSGGSSNKDQNFTWDQTVDFTLDGFYYYRRDHGGISNPSITDTKQNKVGNMVTLTNRIYAAGNNTAYTTFIKCDIGNKFKKLTTSDFKQIEISGASSKYAGWSICIVLEDGTMMYSEPCDQLSVNAFIRRKMIISQNHNFNYTGNFMLYALDASMRPVGSGQRFIHPGLYHEIAGSRSGSWLLFDVSFTNIKFLNY